MKNLAQKRLWGAHDKWQYRFTTRSNASVWCAKPKCRTHADEKRWLYHWPPRVPMAKILARINQYTGAKAPADLPTKEILMTEYWVNQNRYFSKDAAVLSYTKWQSLFELLKNTDNEFHADHIYPHFLGGKMILKLPSACPSCNLKNLTHQEN